MGKEPGLYVTHDQEIVSRYSDFPENAYVAYIGNYPGKAVAQEIDEYAKPLIPPNSMWDAVLNTGDKKEVGSGWASTNFDGKYLEYLAHDDDALEKATELKARSLVRPVYIGHHPSKEMYSPARLAVNFIKDYVDLGSDSVSDIMDNW